MGGPNEAQLAAAKHLLACEGASGGSSKECAFAAERVYEKLNLRLGSLLGIPGVRALFVRSAKLAGRDLSAISGVAFLDSSATLSAFLQGLEPAIAHQAAEVLFGTFLSLITTFIGERLTLQVLRSAWPTIDDPAARENKE